MLICPSNFYKLSLSVLCPWNSTNGRNKTSLEFKKRIFTFTMFSLNGAPVRLRATATNSLNITLKWNVLSLCRERSMQQTYEALCCEVTHLHSELKLQAGLIRKLRPLINETRQGEAHTHTRKHAHAWHTLDCAIVVSILSETPPALSRLPFPVHRASCIPPYIPPEQILANHLCDAASTALRSFFTFLLFRLV